MTTTSLAVADRSGTLLQQLVPSIKKTVDLVREVAAAASEQATAVSQINKAMTQVDQVTQRNSSASEELASTAEELASQAAALREMMSFFRLAHGAGRDVAAPPPSFPSTPRRVPEPSHVVARALTNGNGRSNGHSLAAHGEHEFERF
jgi:methyl-accepting chemotaxis protein